VVAGNAYSAMTTTVTLDISADHAAFAGHFPGNPLVPGVVLLDETLHAVASTRGLAPGRCTVLAAKFLSAAHPGERLQLVIEPGSNGQQAFTIRAPDRVVASGILTLPAAAASSHES
jgi:3-hydroxymyristoyl/3-hydroxydecanoyl-(acyl carrier protein) dehydratase